MTTLEGEKYRKIAEELFEKMDTNLKKYTKRGRPSKFEPEMCAIVESMCLQGKTKAQICRELRIGTSTYDDWIRNGNVQFSATHIQGQADKRAYWDDLRDENLDNRSFNWEWHEQHYKRQFNQTSHLLTFLALILIKITNITSEWCLSQCLWTRSILISRVTE